MKKTLLFGLAAVLLSTTACVAASDPLATVQKFTLNDVKAAEAIYAANPSVPTFAAATECLAYLDTTLSAAPAGADLMALSVPMGLASGIADLDVALNSTATGLSPVVVEFNAACGGYVEDLKAEAAALAAKAGGFAPFGIKLF